MAAGRERRERNVEVEPFSLYGSDDAVGKKGTIGRSKVGVDCLKLREAN